jgi:tetratricopeptide (TPR) repeat protein
VSQLRRIAIACALAACMAVPAFGGDGPPRIRDPEDTWKSMARAPEREVAEREYEKQMLEGDTQLDYAVAEEQVASRRKKFLEAAIRAYELAANARPESPEPHFRAAAAIHAFYIECDPHEGASLCRGQFSVGMRKQAERVIKHWEAFEKKAPRDPRLVDEPNSVLFERAILHTKLATPEHLARAKEDYLKIIAQSAPGQLGGNVMGNLAETEMMLGDLDNAILHYRRTLEIDQNIAHYFGLTVALDRDEQGSQARAILRTFGISGVRDLENKINVTHEVFYVPEGEAYYYLALGYEAVGIDDLAMRYYDAFLASGAHPQFAPRARANREALAKHPHRTPPPDTREKPRTPPWYPNP